MLTVFTVPKPFVGDAAVSQRNALGSWARLGSETQLIVFGDEPGAREAAEESGACWVPEIARNEYGTPLLDAVFREAHRLAGGGLLCWANADLLLLDDVLPALGRVGLPRFLLGGRRWNLEVSEAIAFDDGWQERLRRRVAESGFREKPWGSDYFVFPADGAFSEVPPFAVGRPNWDNWLIFRARRLGIPVVDASRALTVVHPVHGWEHVAGRKGPRWEGPEGDRNRELAQAGLRDPSVVFHLWDATHVLTPRGARRTVRPQALWRRWRTRCA